MRIVVVDDDDDSRATWLKLLQDEYPKASISGSESLMDAGNADYLLIDISAVAPMMMGDMSHAWGPISNYAQKCPGADIIIISGVSRNCANDVMDDCVRFGNVAQERLHYAGFLWDDVKRKLQEVIP